MCKEEYGEYLLKLFCLSENLRLTYTYMQIIVDSKGMPKYAFIYADAMTEQRGDSPKEGKKRHSNPGKVVKNRLFAAQIIAGPVDAILYISVDQTISGGANIAVEVQRVATEHLTKMLAAEKMHLPKIQYWQFDNCGENKALYSFI